VSGTNVEVWHRGTPLGWEERALSLLKAVRVCMAVCHTSAGTSPQPLYCQEKADCADMERYEIFTNMPKGNMYLPSHLRSSPGCGGRHMPL